MVEEVFNIRPSAEELEKIVLKQEDLTNIINSINKQSTLSQEKKQRMLEVIITDLKTQEWMKQKGFPICEKCGQVMLRKTFGEKNICQFCQSNTN